MNGQFFVQSAPPPALAATVTRTGKVRLSRTTVAAGRYRITVHDRSARDNFHLRGPGVNRRTGKRAQGAWTRTVTLVAGRYVYGSDRTGLRRRLAVG